MFTESFNKSHLLHIFSFPFFARRTFRLFDRDILSIQEVHQYAMILLIKILFFFSHSLSSLLVFTSGIQK